ncbi:hypothetical protein MWN34_10655 [Ancylobacter sp. 6x-1]|uniref:Uncharacterized protein n=2 Tax=Ancylobacter crimeensis TaxID=2579147 RepID=A0ABT0DC97_9HYPH|nr:hypothetical protein [Ancylobacter crimeensis]
MNSLFRSRRGSLTRSSVIGLLALVLSGGGAFAESCADLIETQARIGAMKGKLLATYPGTAATLFGCAALANQQPEGDRLGTVLVCAGVACLSIGVGTCMELGTAASELEKAAEEVKRRKLALGCGA